MRKNKQDKVIRKGDPLFEKLKSQMRPDIARGLKTITLIKADCEDCGLPRDKCECKQGGD